MLRCSLQDMATNNVYLSDTCINKSLLTVHHQHSPLCAYYTVDVIPYDILTAFTQISLALNPSNVFTTVR